MANQDGWYGRQMMMHHQHGEGSGMIQQQQQQQGHGAAMMQHRSYEGRGAQSQSYQQQQSHNNLHLHQQQQQQQHSLLRQHSNYAPNAHHQREMMQYQLTQQEQQHHNHSEGMLQQQISHQHQQGGGGYLSQYGRGVGGDGVYGNQQQLHAAHDGYTSHSFYPQQHQQQHAMSMQSSYHDSSNVYGAGMDPSFVEQQQQMMMQQQHQQPGEAAAASEAPSEPSYHLPPQQPPQLFDRRESLPFQLSHKSQRPTQATPMQQQSLYNGPPVSALVPRAPRENDMDLHNKKAAQQQTWPHSHGFTPAASNNKNEPGSAYSFSTSTTTKQPQHRDNNSNLFATAAKTGQHPYGGRGRTSMGFSILGMSPDFFAPTPSSRMEGLSPPNLSPDGDSPPIIPPPPPGAVLPPREDSPPMIGTMSVTENMVAPAQLEAPKPQNSKFEQHGTLEEQQEQQRGPLCATSKSNHLAQQQHSSHVAAEYSGQTAESSMHAQKPHGSTNSGAAAKQHDVLEQEASLLMGLRTGDSATKQQQQQQRTSPSNGAALPPRDKKQQQQNFAVKPKANPISALTTKFKDPPDLAAASSTDTAETNGTTNTADSNSLPKTCFPVAYPPNYPRRLTTPNDHIKLNSLHCYIRSDLLEVFVVEQSNTDIKFRHAPSSSVGRVGLRCVHCAIKRNRSFNDCLEDEAPMSVFYPKAITEIYRLVTSWQRCHLRKCRNLPPAVRQRWNELRMSDKSRGKTAYWIESAHMIGLRDCPSKAGGMRFEVSAVEANNDDAASDESPERPSATATNNSHGVKQEEDSVANNTNKPTMNERAGPRTASIGDTSNSKVMGGEATSDTTMTEGLKSRTTSLKMDKESAVTNDDDNNKKESQVATEALIVKHENTAMDQSDNLAPDKQPTEKANRTAAI